MEKLLKVATEEKLVSVCNTGSWSFRYKFHLRSTDKEVWMEQNSWTDGWSLTVRDPSVTVSTSLFPSSTLEQLIDRITSQSEKDSRNWNWWNHLFHPHQPILREISELLGDHGEMLIIT